MRILIVEDEKRLADVLAHILEEHKYLTDIAYDGQDGLDYALGCQYDAIILDVMMPKMDGFAVVRELRRLKKDVPVLMLTAKGTTPDKVRGLDSGADDYLTKPFETEELLARIRALTRRQGEVVLDELVSFGLKLDLTGGNLSGEKKSVHLGFKEFEVMKILMANGGNVVPKEDLITKVWGYDSNAEDNNVEAYISFLRKKIAFVGGKASIVTLRKFGYRLEAGE